MIASLPHLRTQFLKLALPLLVALVGLLGLGLYLSPTVLAAVEAITFTPFFFSGTYFTRASAVGDVNNDGALDLIVGNSNQPSLVYLNDGTGNFPAGPEMFGAANDTRGLALGDVNRDGWLDVAAVNHNQNPVVYVNDKTGHFPTPLVLSGAYLTPSVAFGDLDADSDLDLVVGNYGQTRIYFGNGSGGFFAPSPIGPLSNTTAIALGDLDNDGDLDMALANYGQLGVVLLNNGAGGFPTQRSFGTGANLVALDIGDMNGDGALDLVAGFGGATLVYFNDGAGNFPTGTTIGTSANSLDVGDIDGDGALDVVVGWGSLTGAGQNHVYLNNGTGASYTSLNLGNIDNTLSMALGDFDADSALDIFVGNYFDDPGPGNAGENVLYFNDGANRFPTALPVGPTDNLFNVAVGDLNRDGALDLVVANSAAASKIYLNNGSGGFPTGTPFGAVNTTLDFAVADFNGDGALDLFAAVFNLPNVVYLNNGSGGFPSGTNIGVSGPAVSAVSGDVDNDGDLDVVVGYDGQPSRVYFNNGAGNFPSNLALNTATDTRAVGLADFDRDGALDIVLANNNAPNAVYFNNGAGSFPLSTTFGVTATTEGIALADFNGDGAVDVAQANYGQQGVVYLNDGAGNLTQAMPYGVAEYYSDVDTGDMDGDGDMDLVASISDGLLASVGLFWNDGTGQFSAVHRFGDVDFPQDMAVGDLNNDGALDVMTSNYSDPVKVLFNILFRAERLANDPPWPRVKRPGNDANFFSTPTIYSNPIIPITYTLFDREGDRANIRAFYSLDGGGQWFPAKGNSITTSLATTSSASFAVINNTPSAVFSTVITSAIAFTQTDFIADLDVMVNVNHTWVGDVVMTLTSPSGMEAVLVDRLGNGNNGSDNFPNTTFDDEAVVDITSVITTTPLGRFRPQETLSRFDRSPANGVWTLTLQDVYPPLDDGQLLSWRITATLQSGAVQVFNWDTFASGVFGQSDNVVFRVEAYPSLTATVRQPAGPYQRPYLAAQTFPFRVRGTQIRVMNGASAAANALVYRLPNGQANGGSLLMDSGGTPFRTDALGYLRGRGQLNVGDQLLALVPITWTDTYTVYYTNGTPTADGVTAHTVSTSGVQTLTVSAAKPLALFNVFVSLEWDSTNDPAYLEQLQFNLQRASEFLYDFTNGQAALGNVIVEQNADDWAYANIAIHANNRLRPHAAQGGIVLTETVDFNPVLSDVVYAPSQVHMGVTWNRYGTPGQNIGDDWAIILAHELSHYLLFLDDTYLGLDANGFLIPVNTCAGSAMGDLYSDPANTEFIWNNAEWLASGPDRNCQDTLAHKTLNRNEWQTIKGWYPALVSPTVINTGPGQMPFDFTAVEVLAPLTSTHPLVDPTFYLNYVGGGGSSNEARAYLLRDNQYIIDLGSPFSGQNRVRAWGAKTTDRLCVFDRPRQQFGCEVLADGDDQLQMRQDATWNPLVQVSPVNSTTFNIQVNLTGAVITQAVRVRLFPEFGPGTLTYTLTANGSIYSGTITTTEPALNGQIQLWVNETGTETFSRREAMVAYSIGGNPGSFRAGGGSFRAGGGSFRAGGGSFRAGGGSFRAGGAPVVSPDGQMIFFTENPIIFQEGQFFAIQGMAALPAVPAGRTIIGTGYRLVATPGTPVLTGSVSIQYLSNDVTVAGVNEEGLSIYFYNGTTWTELPTTRSTYFNLVTAPSQGVGVYALMASLQIPLEAPGWNLFAYPIQASQPVSQALASINGYYSHVYGYYAASTNPWRLYWATAPVTYVNDLMQLEFGRGYWISATQAITIHLSPPVNGLLVPETLPATPPDTFYGSVNGNVAFVPSAGMMVQAYVNGNLCGEGVTLDVGGQVVYVVDVWAADSTHPDCGQAGGSVVLVVNGQRMNTGMWDNTQPTELTLTPAQIVYLPVMQR